ncbi:MAG: HD domain-containing protein [Clostridiales bacterium]|nr:HD domain-containing protein [Clostridiales bacterium]
MHRHWRCPPRRSGRRLPPDDPSTTWCRQPWRHTSGKRICTGKGTGRMAMTVTGENDRQMPVSGGIDKAMLDGLAAEVAASGLSPKRLRHVLAVRDMAARLAELYCPEDTELLQAAALLHDMTKELSPQEQIALCDRYGIPRTRGDVLAPKCFHAMTAAALIPVMYPAFADPRIVSAVRWHTTGRVGMTLDEKLIYLADYIDESRTFPDCVTLRNLFWDAHPEQMEMPARLAHLRTVLIVSYDMTITGLIRDGVPVSPDTFLARNELLCEQNGL